MEQSTWAAALVPWVDAAGLMFAHAVVIGFVVGIPLFCVVTFFGMKKKQEERRGPFRAKRPPGARKRAVMRILLRPLARKQGKAKVLSI